MSKRSIYSKDYELLLKMLREAREESAITQAELAKSLGVTQSALSKYERGELRLDVVQARNWCRAVRASFSDFVAEFDKRLGRM